jgi:nucleotide-binding universal stress UspA family protein
MCYPKMVDKTVNNESCRKSINPQNYQEVKIMLYKNICLSLAGQQDENRLIAESMRIVIALNACLTVIHINDPNAGMGHIMPDENPKITKENMIDDFISLGFGKYVDKIEFVILEGKPFAKKIAEVTRKYDLLIMGHHHKNLLQGLLLSGLDEKVADRIRCPLLLVPVIAD